MLEEKIVISDPLLYRRIIDSGCPKMTAFVFFYFQVGGGGVV
jgi:hypothetical protein